MTCLSGCGKNSDDTAATAQTDAAASETETPETVSEAPSTERPETISTTPSTETPETVSTAPETETAQDTDNSGDASGGLTALELSKLMGNGINLGNTMETYGRP